MKSEKVSEKLFYEPVQRTLAVIVGALVVSILISMALPLYLPFSLLSSIGTANLLFPLVWLVLFFYCAICVSMLRVWLVLGVLAISHSIIMVYDFLTVAS